MLVGAKTHAYAGTNVRNPKFCKCKVLHLAKSQYRHKWGDEEIESSPAEKYWGALVVTSWVGASRVHL